jgi:hypothetical protein
MAASPDTGDDCMKRAVFVALATGLAITSAAALDIAGARAAGASIAGLDEVAHAARARASARAEQRERIEQRYRVERTECESLGGYRRDRCMVKAHAARGRALLEAAAPYEVRY